VVGPCPDEATLIAKGEALRAELGLEALLVTRGEQGVTLLQGPAGPPPAHPRARGVRRHRRRRHRLGGPRLRHRGGASLRDATLLANLAAGVVVGKLGTATASIDEIREAMNAHAPIAHGLLDVDAALAACQRARAAGERIAVLLGPSASPTRPCWRASTPPGGRPSACW
jgi:D-beta-D-heptose 7-phosphate kinase/D-beta-D-heptose 1-phosphate adenosyltransferase